MRRGLLRFARNDGSPIGIHVILNLIQNLPAPDSGFRIKSGMTCPCSTTQQLNNSPSPALGLLRLARNDGSPIGIHVILNLIQNPPAPDSGFRIKSGMTCPCSTTQQLNNSPSPALGLLRLARNDGSPIGIHVILNLIQNPPAPDSGFRIKSGMTYSYQQPSNSTAPLRPPGIASLHSQ